MNAKTLQYFPTPEWLVDLAWGRFQNRDFERVLDACAGTGAMADGFGRRVRDSGRHYHRDIPIDCIEVDLRHHAALREKGYTIVGLDHLAFEGGSIYSHVILNPPFSQGAAHVLKAWDGLWAGEIVAILNAETLRNPYSADRQRLVRLVTEHGSAEFFADAFKGEGVEREAQVEVALVHLSKPAQCTEDWVGPVIDSLRVDRVETETFQTPTELALPNNFVTNQCIAFRMAVKAMREAVRAEAVAKVFQDRIGKTMAAMTSDGDTEAAVTHDGIRNEFRKRYLELKDRAWANVLRSTEALDKLSSKVQKQAESQFEQIKTLEFNESNVWGFLLGLVENKGAMQIDMMLDVFDQISKYHTDNLSFYRGWKSNDLHRTCGMRIRTTRFILPGHGVDGYARSPRWETLRMLSDFDKVFALLAGAAAPEMPLTRVFSEQFQRLKRGERVSASYFDVRFYPGQGTIHFFARSKELVDRLNRWVGQRRKWMPPPEQQGTETFWKAYAKSEAMDKEVREAIRKSARVTGNRVHSWDDPINEFTSQDDERRESGRRKLLAGIESVLEKHGLLEALAAEEATSVVTDRHDGPQLLLLAA